MSLVTTDSSIVVCAESNDDMRWEERVLLNLDDSELIIRNITVIVNDHALFNFIPTSFLLTIKRLQVFSWWIAVIS